MLDYMSNGRNAGIFYNASIPKQPNNITYANNNPNSSHISNRNNINANINIKINSISNVNGNVNGNVNSNGNSNSNNNNGVSK